LDAALDAASMRQHTFISGFQPEAQVASLLCAADVVALPFRDGASFRRGSLMAALHYARPLISTTPAVPIPEFSDGGSMLLVPPDDAPALAQALRRLHHDPVMRASLSAGAAALAERFSWSNIALQTAAFLRGMVHT
jgi:glycosyltransferase involved in cell wall biosynthesis